MSSATPEIVCDERTKLRLRNVVAQLAPEEVRELLKICSERMATDHTPTLPPVLLRPRAVPSRTGEEPSGPTDEEMVAYAKAVWPETPGPDDLQAVMEVNHLRTIGVLLRDIEYQWDRVAREGRYVWKATIRNAIRHPTSAHASMATYNSWSGYGNWEGRAMGEVCRKIIEMVRNIHD